MFKTNVFKMAECKYYKQVRQVSYDNGVTWISLDEYQKGDLYENDSPDCGGGITQYKWVNVSGEYTCVGTTKYQKTKKQQSTDGGRTWTDVNPPEYSTGAVIERDSSDCGGGSSYENQYFTINLKEISPGSYGSVTLSGATGTFQISVDEGQTWSNMTSGSYLSTAGRIMFRGNLVPSSSGIGRFVITRGAQFEVEGNIMSLLYGDNFRGQTSLNGKDYAFYRLFSGCTSMTSAENLSLPATVLAESCYEGMFFGCTSLTVAPELPATTLANNCYYGMFNGCTSLTVALELPATTLKRWCYSNMFFGCTSLTTAPNLPATTLAEYCYYGMFWNCSGLTTAPSILPAITLTYWCYASMFDHCRSLTTAPELPATALVGGCYLQMFYGCSSLNYIKCLATDISATDCTGQWLNFVSSSGAFVKASSMSSWTRGVNGIPTNWTVQNA